MTSKKIIGRLDGILDNFGNAYFVESNLRSLLNELATSDLDIQKCSYADKYKTMKRPICNCISCRDKYIDTIEAQRDHLTTDRRELIEALETCVTYMRFSGYTSIHPPIKAAINTLSKIKARKEADGDG